MSSAGVRKDVLVLLHRAQREGAVVAQQPNGHWRVMNPSINRSVQISFSPRNPGYVREARKKLRSIGLLEAS